MIRTIYLSIEDTNIPIFHLENLTNSSETNTLVNKKSANSSENLTSDQIHRFSLENLTKQAQGRIFQCKAINKFPDLLRNPNTFQGKKRKKEKEITWKCFPGLRRSSNIHLCNPKKPGSEVFRPLISQYASALDCERDISFLT